MSLNGTAGVCVFLCICAHLFRRSPYWPLVLSQNTQVSPKVSPVRMDSLCISGKDKNRALPLDWVEAVQLNSFQHDEIESDSDEDDDWV